MYALTNKHGLFIMSMGNTRGDVSFTKIEKYALKFATEEEARHKMNTLPLLRLNIVQLQNDYVKERVF